MKVIELKEIQKVYGKRPALEHVSFSVEKGHIVGLIGPNGAGKTTIMKIIGGLAHETSGQVRLFESEERLEKNRDRISFMIENPIIDGSLTAMENMKYVRLVRGVADDARCEKLLKYVGLADTGKKAAKHFSLGMKQRLGIAMALLPDPEVLVLDEPVNGLDPEGIVEVRHILKELCEQEGKTIIISSHLLAELSELCTDYVIINEGQIVESLSKEELMQHSRSYISIRTDRTAETVAALEQTLSVHDYKVMEDDELRLYEYLDDVAKVSRTITEAGFTILRFVQTSDSLEEYYLSRVSHGKTEQEKYSPIRNLFGRRA
ncbi:MAG: ABC transporter ATP-binding protein [Eubacterium sp.]|nr:ABC transporter ATP-binding protein [Eubacterium sp.]